MVEFGLKFLNEYNEVENTVGYENRYASRGGYRVVQVGRFLVENKILGLFIGPLI